MGTGAHHAEAGRAWNRCDLRRRDARGDRDRRHQGHPHQVARTNNPINTVRATLAALQMLRTAQQVAELRGKDLEQIVGRRLASAYRRDESTAAAVGTATPAETR